MPQPTFPAIRAALAAYLGSAITGLRTTANRFGQVNPPCAVIVPQTGRIIAYGQSFDGETNYYLRVIMLVSYGDSAEGQDLLDGYLSPEGAQSINAAVQADPTLGGAVSWTAVVEATGYGVMQWMGVDYLACSLVLNIGT